MEIIDHVLKGGSGGRPVEFRESPNQSAGLEPLWLVMHYTAGASFESSVDWLTTARRYPSSAHLVIGRDGEIAQLVRFDRRAWHAGASYWKGKRGLNRYSIGVELDNAGKLHRVGGEWRTAWEKPVPPSEVIEATHKHHDVGMGWHAYTEAQLAAAREVALLLVEEYELRDVVGHDDVAPGRKTDPGPAFPMAAFRAALYGRAEEEQASYTTARLNIRQGPGTQHPQLGGGKSPLPLGTEVTVQDAAGAWRFVRVEPHEGPAFEGWVHGRYLAG